MNHASLFSGIGGFDLAAEWNGWNNVFNCEWEEFPRKVLKHHFPNAKQYEDIKDFNANEYFGRIDVLSGGFPCQPFSTAGKQLGTEDERHLWPEMLRVIGECQPRWVVGENVRGLVSWSDGLVLETCYSDLENLGYSVQSFIIPACAAGAPHRRDRVWIIANRERIRLEHTQKPRSVEECERKTRLDVAEPIETNGKRGNAPDTEHNGQPTTERGRSHEKTSRGSKKGQKITKQFEGVYESEKLGSLRNALDTDNELPKCGNGSREDGRSEQTERTKPLDESRGWEEFPTVPPICGGDDGLPKELDGITFSKWRRESIKAYGNAIVPQVAQRIFESIQQYENEQP